MDQIDPKQALAPSQDLKSSDHTQPDGSGNLDQIGLVDGIADGERIWSARFIGDRVTSNLRDHRSIVGPRPI